MVDHCVDCAAFGMTSGRTMFARRGTRRTGRIRQRRMSGNQVMIVPTRWRKGVSYVYRRSSGLRRTVL